MGPIKIILNPIAGRGYGARSEPDLRRFLDAAGVDFDLQLTERPGHATELAKVAARDGFELIVAAGGDGTTNEVVNGLLAASEGGSTRPLGVIPVGSGSDFANNVGVPANLEEACRRLSQGQNRAVDVCRVTVDEEAPFFFDNTVNIGFGGIVTLEARKVKWVRGMALYLPVVLKTIFLSQATRVTIEYDNQTLEADSSMICVGNGPREGGGFFCTPGARPDDGLLDMCVVQDIGRLRMLRLVPRFMNGSHAHSDGVTMAQAKHIVVSSEDDLVAHADGEMLCTEAHRIEFDVVPSRLQVRC